MTKKVKIKLLDAGIQQVLKSTEVQDILMEQANTIAASAGHSKVEIGTYRKRAKAEVIQDATSEDMEQNTLLKAVPF